MVSCFADVSFTLAIVSKFKNSIVSCYNSSCSNCDKSAFLVTIIFELISSKHKADYWFKFPTILTVTPAAPSKFNNNNNMHIVLQ